MNLFKGKITLLAIVTLVLLVISAPTSVSAWSGDDNSGKSGKSGNTGGPNSCTPCKGGLSSLTLRNDGSDTYANVTGKKGDELYSEFVVSGGTFTYDSNGKMDNSIFINGADIHTSCSKPINAGMEIGDFTLISVTSAKTGDVLCELPVAETPPTVSPYCEQYQSLAHLYEDRYYSRGHKEKHLNKYNYYADKYNCSCVTPTSPLVLPPLSMPRD